MMPPVRPFMPDEATIRVVLAAIDTTDDARSVLDTAIQIGHLIEVDVAAVHVRSNPVVSLESSELLVARAGVPLRVLEGSVNPLLLDALRAPDVAAAVIGAGGTSGGRPVGRTALHIIEHLDKPVVLVPHDAVAPAIIRRLLVPLEGVDASSKKVIQHLRPLVTAGVELVVLHVFTEATRPTMLDRPYRDLEILGKEFLIQHCPVATDIELRQGPVAATVAEMTGEHSGDLIVLSWSQDSSPGRATVVREVIGASRLPVLLLPE